MFKKVGISLMAALMMSSVVFAGDFAPAGDEENKQESKQEERAVINFDKEFIKEFLMEDEKYPEWVANLMVNTVLPTMSAKLQPVLDAYLVDRTIDSTFHVKEVTIPVIMKGYQCDFWAALVYMDMFIQHPKDTELSIQILILPCMADDAGKNKKIQTNVSTQPKKIQFDKQFVKILLIKEEKHSLSDAGLEVNTILPTMSAQLQPVLDAYLADRTIDSTFHVKEVTMSVIMKGYNCDFWVALDHMDSFINRPEGTSILTDPELSRWRFR